MVVPYCAIADVGVTLPRLLSLGKSIFIHGSNVLNERERERELGKWKVNAMTL